MRIAEEFPMVCDQELQLMRHTFPDCQVERVHWRLEEGHSCGFRITPQQPDQLPQPVQPLQPAPTEARGLPGDQGQRSRA